MKQSQITKAYLITFLVSILFSFTITAIPHKRPVIEKTNQTKTISQEEVDKTELLNKESYEKFNALTEGYEKPVFLGNVVEKQNTTIKTVDLGNKNETQNLKWEKPKYGPQSKDLVEGFHMELKTFVGNETNSDIVHKDESFEEEDNDDDTVHDRKFLN